MFRTRKVDRTDQLKTTILLARWRRPIFGLVEVKGRRTTNGKPVSDASIKGKSIAQIVNIL
jgi:hypothetical protein